jgi:broad specificity phosphatase PhoE
MTIFDITLLRHAQSFGNHNQILQGQQDTDLTDSGVQQAEELAEFWSRTRKSFDLVIASPLKRAQQTAAIIADKLELPVEIDANWMERDFGNYEGIKYDDLRVQKPPVDFYHPYNTFSESGESVSDLYSRGGTVLQSLLNREPGDYLVVSHGAFLNMVVYNILGLGPMHYARGPRFNFRNTGFARVTFDPEGFVWRFLELNANPQSVI